MIENYEAKSLFLSSKIHRSVFLSGQAIENTKYVDILEKPCIKNHWLEILSSKILNKLFSILFAKTLF